MDEAKLKQLLKKDENPKIDFKQSLSLNTDGEKKELTRDVLAIANSRGGRGYIVFGVEDKTKNILGIDPKSFNEEQIQQIIYSRCDPPVPISLDILKVQGKWLAVITIFKSHHKPHQMIQNGAFYLRRGSTTDVAKRYEIANLFQENGMMSYETVVFKNATLDHLNIEGIKKYFSKLGVFGENPNNVLLESMGFIGKGGMGEQFHPTIGGMLLFGRNLHMFLPHAFVKVICGEDVLLFCDNVVKVLDDVSNILEKKITEKDYPLDALKEALANAIVHRDYLDNSNGITVIINKKEISISNPGPLIAGNHLYRFAREKNPMRRNPWLYQRLMILDEKKRFLKLGSGITKIKKSFSKMGGVKFINLGEDNLFKVIFPRI